MRNKRRLKLWLIVFGAILASLYFFLSTIVNAWLAVRSQYHGRWAIVFFGLTIICLFAVGMAIYQLFKRPKQGVQKDAGGASEP